MSDWTRYVPIAVWGASYQRDQLGSDLLAATIVTIMLIPQSLAYALLAGLPAEVGLYASITPLVAYAIFGTSNTLAVGPVAVVSLMTASAISEFAAPGSAAYLQAAILLALLSGGLMLLLGLLRMGFLASFLSHPVIAGFITASGLIIMVSQLKHLLGVTVSGDNLYVLLREYVLQAPSLHLTTLYFGVGVLAFLLWTKSGLKPLLMTMGLKEKTAGLLARTGPVIGVIATSVIAYLIDAGSMGVRLIGDIPAGLPDWKLPELELSLASKLLPAAAMISLIGFVESIAVAQTLAAKRGEKIRPDQELIGLGSANISSAFSGGYPVTGGFARSVVNFDAGAATPAAGLFAAIGIAATALFLTPYLAYLPQATLAATIIVAVLSLLDFSVLKKTWHYNRFDFIAVTITLLGTLVFGVEAGVFCGVIASLILHIYKSSRPHIAVVGKVAGTEHFRNIERHGVVTHPEILSVRVDESLYFANISYFEDRLLALLDERSSVQHVIVLCTAINEIDLTALEVLEMLNETLYNRGISLNLSEVKGPVMDTLSKTDFPQQLTGKIFLSHHQAVTQLGGYSYTDAETYVI
mgnify:CR=1 FL=1